MNPISNLLDFRSNHDDEERVLTAEEKSEIAAEEKRERIEWHRRNVRNGPAKFGVITAGRQKSRFRRRQEADARKATLKHRRAWIRNRHYVAILRGQLQALGVVEYTTPDHKATSAAVASAATWVVREFGQRDIDGGLVFDDHLFADAVRAAEKFYEEAVAA